MPPVGARITVKVVYDDPPPRHVCVDGQRPCPFAVCPYHLGIEVSRRHDLGLTIDPKLGFVARFPTADTCALDVADRGGATLEEIAAAISITRERVRQLESAAFDHLDGKEGIDRETLYALAAAHR